MLHSIGIIGAGNLSRSIIGGLKAAGYDLERIMASNRNAIKLQALHKDFGIRASACNREVVRQSDVLILGVKPQNVRELSTEIAGVVGERRPLIISLAAGIRMHTISRWLNVNDIGIVRSMSNTPALIRQGATALCANGHITSLQRTISEKLLTAVGQVAWVKDEKELDAITALVSCGPAYFFSVIEAIQSGAQELGVDQNTAIRMALQTALGSITMAAQSDVSIEELRRRVTTPNGVTERAINVLNEGNLSDLFLKAMHAARDRCVELGDMLSSDSPVQTNSSNSKHSFLTQLQAGKKSTEIINTDTKLKY